MVSSSNKAISLEVPTPQNDKEPPTINTVDGPLHVGITQPKGKDFQKSIWVHGIKEEDDSNGLLAKKPPMGKTYHLTDGNDLK